MSIMERGGGINATVGPTRDASIQELVSVGRERVNRMLEFGVTTVEGKSGYGMDRNTELKQLRAMKELDASHPVDIVTTFLGAPTASCPSIRERSGNSSICSYRT